MFNYCQTSVLSLPTEGSLVDLRAYKPYTLVGPPSLMTGTSPPSCLFLDNRLYIHKVWILIYSGDYSYVKLLLQLYNILDINFRTYGSALRSKFLAFWFLFIWPSVLALRPSLFLFRSKCFKSSSDIGQMLKLQQLVPCKTYFIEYKKILLHNGM